MNHNGISSLFLFCFTSYLKLHNYLFNRSYNNIYFYEHQAKIRAHYVSWLEKA